MKALLEAALLKIGNCVRHEHFDVRCSLRWCLFFKNSFALASSLSCMRSQNALAVQTGNNSSLWIRHKGNLLPGAFPTHSPRVISQARDGRLSLWR